MHSISNSVDYSKCKDCIFNIFQLLLINLWTPRSVQNLSIEDFHQVVGEKLWWRLSKILKNHQVKNWKLKSLKIDGLAMAKCYIVGWISFSSFIWKYRSSDRTERKWSFKPKMRQTRVQVSVICVNLGLFW